MKKKKLLTKEEIAKYLSLGVIPAQLSKNKKFVAIAKTYVRKNKREVNKRRKAAGMPTIQKLKKQKRDIQKVKLSFFKKIVTFFRFIFYSIGVLFLKIFKKGY